MPGKELTKKEEKELNNLSLTGTETIADMLRHADILLKSGMMPDAIKRPEQIVVIMEVAKAMDIPPIHALNSINVIKGKPTMSAELMRSLVQRRYPEVNIDILENTDKICRISVARPGGKPQEFKFTIEQAQRAGIAGKESWQKYPEDMLLARATSRMVRAIFPEVTLGTTYTAEELGAEVDKDGCVVSLPDDEEIARAFTELDVTRDMLDRYCLDHFKHDLSQIDEKEVGELRTVFNAIKVKKEPIDKYFKAPQPPGKPLPPPEQISITDVEKPDPETKEKPKEEKEEKSAKSEEKTETKPETKEKTDEELIVESAAKERYKALLVLTQRHRNEFKNPVYSTVIDKCMEIGLDPVKKCKYLESMLSAIGVDVEQALVDLANEKG